MKIIFLDIDGVLNSKRWFSTNLPTDIIDTHMFRDTKDIDPAAVRILSSVIKDSGAKIVVSSSWRIIHSLPIIADIISDASGINILPHIIGMTPIHRGESVIDIGKSRGEEIQEWLDTCQLDIEQFCIVDDDTDMLDTQLPFFVNTNRKTGLTEKHANEIIKILIPSTSNPSNL